MFNKHMCDSLAKIGMVPNKSLLLEFPDIDPALYSHFIRGYYDGDGSIFRHIKSENNHAITVTITSTEQFCKKIVEISKEYIGIKTNIYDASCHNGVTKVFTISGRNLAKQFLDWIYQDAELYLQRKYDRYVEYYNVSNSVNKSLVA